MWRVLALPPSFPPSLCRSPSRFLRCMCHTYHARVPCAQAEGRKQAERAQPASKESESGGVGNRAPPRQGANRAQTGSKGGGKRTQTGRKKSGRRAQTWRKQGANKKQNRAQKGRQQGSNLIQPPQFLTGVATMNRGPSSPPSGPSAAPSCPCPPLAAPA